MAWSLTTHSGRFSPMIATRSPRLIPRAASPQANHSTIERSSVYDIPLYSPCSLYIRTGRVSLANRSVTLRNISGIVEKPTATGMGKPQSVDVCWDGEFTGSGLKHTSVNDENQGLN